jgi:succinyl-CoA synthetase beta subunit
MYSTEGGMDIETVAEKTPHLIHKEEVDPGAGIQAFQARRIAFNLGLIWTGLQGDEQVCHGPLPGLRKVGCLPVRN